VLNKILFYNRQCPYHIILSTAVKPVFLPNIHIGNLYFVPSRFQTFFPDISDYISDISPLSHSVAKKQKHAMRLTVPATSPPLVSCGNSKHYSAGALLKIKLMGISHKQSEIGVCHRKCINC
jgi:hypothetical protein